MKLLITIYLFPIITIIIGVLLLDSLGNWIGRKLKVYRKHDRY
mgnify:CR=1 FL=1